MIAWRRYMEVGLGVLRLAPREFWAMTPAEFAAAVDGHLAARGAAGKPAARPPTRAQLDELMRRFPDRPA